MSNRVKDKVALITGASRGIGAATAKRLAEEGASVIVSDINIDLGNQLVNEITTQGFNAAFMNLDVTEETQWQHIYSEIEKKYGKLNILVNNAGIAMGGSIINMTLKDWRHLMAINLDSVFLGTKHAIPLMRKSGGSIINVSSASGLVGAEFAAAYSASKAGVRYFTKSVALECAKGGYNIRVNSIHPGPVVTPMWDDYVKQAPNEKEAWAAIAASTPLNRIAEAIEIANAILFLASDESSFMTGSELAIDGGFTAQ